MTKSKETYSEQSRMTFISFVVLLLASIILLLVMTLPYLLSLFVGAFVAMLAYPLFLKIQTGRIGPRVASVIVTLGIVLLIVLPVSLFTVLAVQQGITIYETLSADGDFSYRHIISWMKESRFVDVVFGSKTVFENQMREWLQQHGKLLTEIVISFVANIPNILLQLAVTLLACYFFLADGAKLISWMSDKIPLDKNVRAQLAATVKSSVSSTVWSTLAAAGVQSAIMFGAYLALGVPAAVFATGATFIFAWVPVIGSTPVWLGGAIYLYFFDGSLFKALIMLGLGIITGLSDNVVRPVILKGREDMHPMVSLIAIFGGLAMFGILGVFIGPIFAAVVISLLKIWPGVAHRKLEH